jgi:predicted acylesterase/phospholipase RssA
MTPRRRLQSLSLCGGLLKAATLVGCVKALEEADMLGEELVVLSGSSSGAVLAALVATGWSADQIAYQLIEKTSVVGDLLESDPFALSVVQILWTLWRQRCLDRGERMFAFFSRLFGDLTFAQVKERFGKDLIVTAR